MIWWDRQPERLGSLEIDHQFVLGRRLYRKNSRLLAIEDAIDISGRAPILVDKIGSIGDQAASDGERAFEVDRGQLIRPRSTDANPPVATIRPPFVAKLGLELAALGGSAVWSRARMQ